MIYKSLLIGLFVQSFWTTTSQHIKKRTIIIYSVLIEKLESCYVVTETTKYRPITEQNRNDGIHMNSSWSAINEYRNMINHYRGLPTISTNKTTRHDMSEWLLFNANSAIFQLYHGENKLIFNEMMMRPALF